MDKKRIRKHKLALFLPIANLIVIYILSLIITKNYQIIKIGYQNTKWYYTLFLLIGSFIFFMASHELMHAFILVVHKIKIKAIIILNLVLVKKKKVFIPFINPCTFPLIGGMVVPELPKIDNKEDLEKMRNAFKRSLISAPLLNYFTFIIILIIFSILFFLPVSGIVHYLGIYLVVLYFLLIVIIISTSFFKSGNAMGDFAGYHALETDDDFLLTYIISYGEFNKDYLSNYIISLIEERLKENYPRKDFINYYLNVFIKKNLVCDFEILRKLIDLSLIEKASYDAIEFDNYLKSLEILVTLGYKNLAIEKYNILKNKSIEVHKKDYIYQLKLVEHKLGMFDNSEFLNNKKNIRLGLNILFMFIFNYKKEILKQVYVIPCNINREDPKFYNIIKCPHLELN